MAKSHASRTRSGRRKAVHHAMTMTGHPAHPPTSPPTSRSILGRSKNLNGKSKSPALMALLPQLVIASINVNGFSPETEWAVTSLLDNNKYDVSCISPFLLPMI